MKTLNEQFLGRPNKWWKEKWDKTYKGEKGNSGQKYEAYLESKYR
jgi:hypothetical protein